jgi:hypothetical protein
VPPHTNLVGLGEIAITNEFGPEAQMYYRLKATEIGP